MKTQIFLIIALFSLLSYGKIFDPAMLESQIPLPKCIIKEINESQLQQNALVGHLFKLGDIDRDGYFDRKTFGAVLQRIYTYVYNIKISQKFIDENFIIADCVVRDNRINQAEIAFIFAVHLAFTANNLRILRSEDVSNTIVSLRSVEKILEMKRSLIPTFFNFRKGKTISVDNCKVGLNFLGKSIGLDLSFSDQLLNDFIESVDYNDDGKLNQSELMVLLCTILSPVREILATLAH